MIIDAFLDQKRVDVCEKTVKTAPRELRVSSTRMGERQEEGRSGGNGGGFECKLSEVNTRAVSRGQNELQEEFKMAAGDVISITE